ncbi:RNA polymerase sigma factor [Novipirellula artificiosorum]|nr:sigma-70 family RNA polymerase sigma factor [Novipirellula artificiosorum]
MKTMNLQNSDADQDQDQDTLIKEACSDSAAFAQLYRLHYDNVFRYCARRLFNRHTAEDVTSIVFFKAMRMLSSFKGNSRDFRNWLYRIATNAVNDHLRTAKRRADAIRDIALTHGGDHTLDAESTCELQEELLPVKQALLTLKPKQQSVITLRFFEKLKLNEIAEILGQNPATTRSQLSRALSSLRKQLRATADQHGEV